MNAKNLFSRHYTHRQNIFRFHNKESWKPLRFFSLIIKNLLKFTLTHLFPVPPFSTPWKHQKTLQMFSRGRVHCERMGQKQNNVLNVLNVHRISIDLSQAYVLFLDPLKTSENQRFFDVFRGYIECNIGLI